MKKVFYVSMVIAILLATMGVANAGVSMWFTNSAGADVTSLNVVSGSAFTIQVWGSATANSGIGVAVKIDTTTGSTGTSATAAGVSKITFATKTTGVGLVGDDAVWGAGILSRYSGDLSAPKTAGLRATGTVKNWGLYMARDNGGINTPDFSNVLLGTINLKNNMAVNGSYVLEIVSGLTTNSSYNSFINAGSSPYAVATDTLTINSISDVVVPEPGSLLALGSGLAGLVGFVIRKRK